MKSADIRSRLADLAAQRGVSLRALSELIGRNPTYLRQFIHKGSPRKLDEKDRGILAAFFGVSEDELGRVAADQAVPLAERGTDWVNIPRLKLEASAGFGTQVGGEAADGMIRFAAAWLRQQGLDPAMLAAIRVQGDSMEPALRDGDEILVDRAPRTFRDGIYVCRAGDALLVKRVAASRPGQFTLVSDNPVYPPFELNAEHLTLVGRVVWRSGRI